MASAIASTSNYVFTESDLTASPQFSPASTSKPQAAQFYSVEGDPTDSESGETTEDEYGEKEPAKRRDGLIRDGEDRPRERGKTWSCSYQGCIKSYTRRSRLEEHERTHTGEVGPHFFSFLLPSYP
jgi:uncharacterized Zn-finger protein